jgi:hypothetical protein
MIHERRATHYKNLGSRRTYNVKLPMKKSQLWADFPYQVYECSTLIELSSRTEVSPSGDECVCFCKNISKEFPFFQVFVSVTQAAD